MDQSVPHRGGDRLDRRHARQCGATRAVAFSPAVVDRRRATLGHARHHTGHVVTWMLGLALAVTGEWFPSRWLFAKLALVLLLSGVHGVLAGSLRRLALRPDATVPAFARYTPAAIVTAVTLVVVLVVIKPF